MFNKVVLLTLVVGAMFMASCGMTAHKAYHLGNEKFKKAEYEHAIQYYKMAIDKGLKHPKSDKVYFQIGESYRLSNRIHEATPFYENAVVAHTEQDSAYYFYAVGLESLGKYGEAENAFLKYAETGKDPNLTKLAKIEGENLKLIEPILLRAPEYKIDNASFLNSEGADWSPVMLTKDEILFSSSRAQSKIHMSDGQGFNDLWKFKFDGNADTSGVLTNFSKTVNQDQTHEACPTVSKSGKDIYFARSNDGSAKGAKDVGLFLTRFKDGDWAEPVKLSFCEDTSWYSTPWLSPDNKTLYFSSNRPGGQGGLDLWKATLDKNMQWADVTNLGDVINTHGDEYSIAFKGDQMYFASTGHPGLGRLDLFRVDKDSVTGKDVVHNLGLPFNSVSDDFGMVWANDTTAYLTSDREGGKGSDDIYKIKFIEKKAVYNQKVVVWGYNTTTQRERLLKNAHVTIKDAKGNLLADAKTDENGEIMARVPAGAKIEVEARKHKHYTKQEHAVTPDPTPRAQLKEGMNEITFEKPVKVVLQEITPTPIRLEIYYDYNKWDIRPDAAKILDSLVGFLIQNPEIIVELSSHTDTRGNDKYNEKLSSNRAKSAVEYCIAHGVDPKKIVAKGYGETKPLVLPEKNDADYQLNRRTEVRVIKILDLEE
ncbi:MAG: hypothetical protein RLZZ175_1784 [Bacteroidota bacterium]|jgi:peptidoglycan-associated lipoprotein